MKTRKNNTQIFTYETFTEFVKDIKAPQEYTASSRDSDRDKSWDNGLGWEGTLKTVDKGWKEGTKKIKEIRNSVWAKISNRVVEPEIVPDVCGNVPDVSAYLNGTPECMLRWEDVETDTEAGNIIKIIVNGTASAFVKSETIINRGACLLAMIDVLEMCGHYCEVYLYFGNYRDSFSSEMTIKIKEPFEQMDIDRFSFMIAHPACFRRLGFAVFEKSDKDIINGVGITNSGNYGAPKECEQEADIVFPYMDDNKKYDHSWVLDQVKKVGVEVTEE